MKDEIEADVEKAVGEAVEKTERETRIKTRYEDGMPIELIAEKSKVSIDVVNEVLKESGLLTTTK
jgi:Mor family transcriptional regulator